MDFPIQRLHNCSIDVRVGDKACKGCTRSNSKVVPPQKVCIVSVNISNGVSGKEYNLASMVNYIQQDEVKQFWN